MLIQKAVSVELPALASWSHRKRKGWFLISPLLFSTWFSEPQARPSQRMNVTSFASSWTPSITWSVPGRDHSITVLVLWPTSATWASADQHTSLLVVRTPRAIRSLPGSEARVVQRTPPVIVPGAVAVLSPLQLLPFQVREKTSLPPLP